MISWMQRHKKWLVITIWISTIAFVGAGFVGWGSYDFSKQGGAVAVVGEREVSVEEYQDEYSNLYSQYARLFGNSFNQEMADNLNLRDIAYKQVLQKNLILSYADSLGLDVTNEDIAQELVKYQAFLKDGKFDKPTYLKVLAQNRTTAKKFEESLKRGILLTKIQELFVIKPNKVEVENLNKLLFIKDDISMKILEAKNISVSPSEDEIKSYWEKNKNAYMSDIEYEIELTKVPMMVSNANDEDIKKHYQNFRTDFKKADGKIKSLEEAKADIVKELDKKFTKKESLKKYLKVKKGDLKLVESKTYTQATLPFNQENSQKITSAKVGSLIKPFVQDDIYYIVKLAKKIDSKPLSYEKAKNRAKSSLVTVLKDKKLDELANNELKTFKGTLIKDVSRESVDKIKALQTQEAAKFLNDLFSATKKEGIVKLSDKVVLFRVEKSTLGTYDKSKDDSVISTLSQLQDQELMENLVKRLENTFEVQSFINEKE